MMNSATFPIYLLEFKQNEITVVWPERKQDLDHVTFWETDVVYVYSKEMGVSPHLLKNHPYCQRRARVDPSKKLVYYGESVEANILKVICNSLSIDDLKWAFDHHEARLKHDISQLSIVLSQRARI
jgi:hypothetical protein